MSKDPIEYLRPILNVWDVVKNKIPDVHNQISKILSPT